MGLEEAQRVKDWKSTKPWSVLSVAMSASFVLGQLLAFLSRASQVDFWVCFATNAEEADRVDHGVPDDLTEGCRCGICLGVREENVQGYVSKREDAKEATWST